MAKIQNPSKKALFALCCKRQLRDRLKPFFGQVAGHDGDRHTQPAGLFFDQRFDQRAGAFAARRRTQERSGWIGYKVLVNSMP